VCEMIEPLCSGEGLADARAKGWQVQLARLACWIVIIINF
jgi:hypothetical protein